MTNLTLSVSGVGIVGRQLCAIFEILVCWYVLSRNVGTITCGKDTV